MSGGPSMLFLPVARFNRAKGPKYPDVQYPTVYWEAHMFSVDTHYLIVWTIRAVAGLVHS